MVIVLTAPSIQAAAAAAETTGAVEEEEEEATGAMAEEEGDTNLLHLSIVSFIVVLPKPQDLTSCEFP